jgi:3-hydroxyacyl-CoA dehydrogenase
MTGTLHIRRAAVLGAGVMGGGLAALLAGAGIPVLLLDRPPDTLLPEEQAAGFTLQTARVRNRLALQGLQSALRASPPAFFTPAHAGRVAVGNLVDDLPRLREVDWVLEAVVERLDVKRELFARVAPHLGAQALLTSNTSGLSAAALSDALPEPLRRRFCITHFFNPPRHMQLLELVAGPATDPALLAEFAAFAELSLGKGCVRAKDTPDFIANRIGTFAFMHLLGVLARNEAGVAELDMLTGELLGRPRSATFRTADLVGLDTLLHVARHLHEALPHDPARASFQPPPLLEKLVERGSLGAKSGAGFYRKQTDGAIHVLDPRTLDYVPPPPLDPASLGPSARLPATAERVRRLVEEGGRPGRLLWDHLAAALSYAAACVPEVSDEPADVDRALRWGFGWELGPFELLDALGPAAFAERLRAEGRAVPPLLERVLESGGGSFHAGAPGARTAFAPAAGRQVPLAPRPGVLDPSEVRASGGVVESNAEASLLDLGEGVLGVQFHTRLNVLGEGSGQALRRALELLPGWRGLVVGGGAEHFSAGANLALVQGLAESGRFEQLAQLVAFFQQVNQGLRFAPRPVVVAARGLTLGGGCEILLHGARVVAAAESYVGLPEVAAGLVPAAGGCKELVRRVDEALPADVASDRLPLLERVLRTVGTARVSGSAFEARELGFLRESDAIVMHRDRHLMAARQAVLDLARDGWRPPLPREDIRVVGADGLAALRVGLWNLGQAGQATAHDVKVALRLAGVLCGGAAGPGARASEQQLLDLEREAFVSLAGEPATQARIKALLATGKPLRN